MTHSLRVQGSVNSSSKRMHVSLQSSVQPYDDTCLPLGDSLAQAGRATQRAGMREFGAFSEMQNCTFRPAIRASSQARSPRSWASMSRGDYMLKQRSIERTRQQQEELLKATHTFKPVLHTPPNMLASTQGRLMAKDPAFTARMMRKHQDRTFKAQRAQYEREVGIICPRWCRL